MADLVKMVGPTKGHALRYLARLEVAWFDAKAAGRPLVPPKVSLADFAKDYLRTAKVRMTEAALWAGRSLWQSLIRRFAECKAADFWPGVAPGILDYDVTPWADVGQEESEEF